MFLLEGNIGAGKSTLLAMLKKHLPHIIHKDEPITTWEGGDAQQGVLELFYADQQRWAFTMESFTLFTRMNELIKHKASQNLFQPCISERSIYSGFYCFAHLGHQAGTLSEIEWAIYERFFGFLFRRNAFKPQGFIYLKTDPVVCSQRVGKRSRKGESDIPFSYLSDLHDRHEAFLVSDKPANTLLSDVPVLIIEGSHEFERDPEFIKEVCFKVNQFINEHNGAPYNIGCVSHNQQNSVLF